jgi:tyrosine phenol-lyase
LGGALAEPFKIKVVKPVTLTTPEQRKAAVSEAGYNIFLLRSQDVYIGLLTHSATSAMSDWQWAGMMLGDEAYAGSRNFYLVEDAIRRNYRYKYFIPTHQGGRAEHILSRVLIKPGDVIPGNI